MTYTLTLSGFVSYIRYVRGVARNFAPWLCTTLFRAEVLYPIGARVVNMDLHSQTLLSERMRSSRVECARHASDGGSGTVYMDPLFGARRNV